MKKQVIFIVTSLFVSSLVFALTDSGDNDWPRWRGSNMDGKALQKDVFKEGYGLKINWKKQLGSSYSSISIADGRAVTMFSDSTFDYVVALDADNGDELWRFKLDSTYKGHSGSHDGQLSTPTIDGSKIYVYAIKGHLLALDAKTGKKLWSNNVKEEVKPIEPIYGFGSSPIVVGDVLMCQVGDPKTHTICGFDKNSGKLLWSAGADTINYQSPISMTLLGEEQVIGVGDHKIFGVRPSDGNILWEYRHNGRGNGYNPVVISDSEIFIQHSGRESSLLKFSKSDGKYEVEEVWKNRNIRGSYNTSVFHEGFLYGYSGRFLTCVNAKTGETAWKSRQPGDGFTIMVDRHLVVLTKQGAMHVVKASPAGYQEIASTKVFDTLTWTPASFANGKIYARSLTEIASIDIAAVDQLIADETKQKVRGILPDTDFAAFVKKVEKASDKKAAVDKFMESQKQFPVIEKDNLVHIVYRGEAKDLAIGSDLLNAGEELPMNRVADTDLYYYSAKIEPDAVVAYQIIKDFDEKIADPLNENSSRSFNGENAVLYMPKADAADHLNDPTGMTRGKIDTFHFESKIMENSRKVEIYLPPGYSESTEKYPTVYVNYGQQAKDWGKMTNTLDNLIGKTIRPVITVFIHLSQLGFNEISGQQRMKYIQMMAEEFVPHIDKKYRTEAAPESRLFMGGSSGGYNAILTAFKYPGIFSKLAGQSMNIDPPRGDELTELVSNSEKLPVEFYIHWGKYDIRNTTGLDRAGVNRTFAKMLKEKGYTVHGGEFNDGYAYPSWRTRTDDILEAFFPIKTSMK